MPVVFDEENENMYKSTEVFGSPKEPRMIAWLKKKGLVKNEVFAGRVLFIMSLLIIIISLVIFTEGKIIGIGVGEKPLKDSVHLHVDGVGDVFVEKGQKISEVLKKYEK